MRCALKKDVLGMWVGENESAKYWTTVLNVLKNRGVEDIFIACSRYEMAFWQMAWEMRQ